MSGSALGDRGERIAEDYLRGAGWSIIGRNFRMNRKEIDLVARRGGVLALIEVRTRRGDLFGGAALSITPAKRRRMLRAAHAYLAALGDDAPPARIDVIGVTLDRTGRLTGIEHVENAVEAV